MRWSHKYVFNARLTSPAGAARFSLPLAPASNPEEIKRSPPVFYALMFRRSARTPAYGNVLWSCTENYGSTFTTRLCGIIGDGSIRKKSIRRDSKPPCSCAAPWHRVPVGVEPDFESATGSLLAGREQRSELAA